jgi:ERCC4-type nuclease
MIILQDIKEKIPWDFTLYSDVSAQKVKYMKTGDYTVEGHEKSICIERKRTTGEISLNLGSKYKQFKDEFDRMQAFEHRFVICEFPLWLIMDFPKNSGIPKFKWKYLRVNGKFLYNRFMELSNEYNVPVCFTNSSLEAQDLAIALIRDRVCPT